MATLIKKIRTDSGDTQIDYNALANLPSAGTSKQPVYFSNGKPVAIDYTIEKSVPSDAKFTDTTYTLSSFGITASNTELNYVDGVTSSIQTQLNGKAASSHNHSATEITSGTLPIVRGGTGATTVDGILTNLGNIGKVYSHTPSAVSVATGTVKDVATLTLPAGVYIVVANSQWSGDTPTAMYMSRVVSSDGNIVYGTTRGFMVGGGGAQTVAILSLAAQATIKYQVYHGHSTALTAEVISLSAVKIK